MLHSSTGQRMTYKIGCDIGGTFTDVVVVEEDGKIWTDKADTTPGSLADGVENAIANVTDQMGVSPSDLLEETDRFINGTTVVTNVIVELNGVKTGLLTTKGFTDTLRIARSPRGESRDQHQHANVPDIVPRDCIKGIPQRVDYEGKEIVALNEQEVRDAVNDLVENKDVEAISVCYLWSFQNSEHEQRTKEIIKEEYPDLYVTASHEIYPKIREYERMVTTVLNSYTAPDVTSYTDEVVSRLSKLGLDPDVFNIMQGSGGTTTPQEAKREPIHLLESGPVGGVIGAQTLGTHLDIDNIISADMGGTSFECSILEEGEYTTSERVEVRDQVLSGLTKVETNTIGAGGGSVAWIDSRGIPQVGPESAGADPGPACYGQGGRNPTLTDAALVLGLMDPNSFLGGRRELDVEAAERVLQEAIADPLNYDLKEAAAAIYEIAVNSMSNAVRNVTIEEGRDPKEFTLMAYGGAFPMFAADVCDTLDIKDAIIPNSASVFSAYGLLQADDVRTRSESVFWEPGDSVEKINETLSEITSDLHGRLEDAGFNDEEITIEPEGRFKFKGQLFDHPVKLPSGGITNDDIEAIQRNFPSIYEDEYGPGTAWEDVPVIMRAMRVTGVGKTDKPKPKKQRVEAGHANSKTSREVYLPFERGSKNVDVYNGETLNPETTITGPSIVEKGITTIFIPSGYETSIDAYNNYILTQTDDAESSVHIPETTD